VTLLRAPARLGGSAPANRVLDAFSESRIHLSQSDVGFLLAVSCRAMVLPVFRASSFGGCSRAWGGGRAGVALLRAYGIVQASLRVGSGLASACAVSCQGSCPTPAFCVAFRIVVCYSYCGRRSVAGCASQGRRLLPSHPTELGEGGAQLASGCRRSLPESSAPRGHAGRSHWCQGPTGLS
jgi:hypothetical protein